MQRVLQGTSDGFVVRIGDLFAGAVSITVTPSTATLGAGQTQQFTASVTGLANTAVTWSLNPNVGTISPTGLYTAPANITGQQIVTLTATSAADSTRAANASITLTPSVSITISPTTASLGGGDTQQFFALVVNTPNPAVTWSINPQAGTISSTGLYTAPATITSTFNVTVTATSVADPTKSASAVLTLVSPVAEGPVISLEGAAHAASGAPLATRGAWGRPQLPGSFGL